MERDLTLQRILEAKKQLVNDSKRLLLQRTEEALALRAFQGVENTALKTVNLGGVKDVLLDWKISDEPGDSECGYEGDHIALRSDGGLHLLSVYGKPDEDGKWEFSGFFKGEIPEEGYINTAPLAIKQVEGLIAEAKKNKASIRE